MSPIARVGGRSPHFALLALVAVLAAACSSQDGDQQTTPEPGGEGEQAAEEEVSDTGALDPKDLQVGDCFNAPTPDEQAIVLSVDAVSCERPHDREVYGVDRFDDTEFPGNDVLASQIRVDCEERFEAFAGAPFLEAALLIETFWPDEQSWRTGDRQAICTVGDGRGGTLTGTAEALGADVGFIHTTGLQEGDCLDFPDHELFIGVEAVPCEEPHDAEVYLTFDGAGTDYPGADALFEQSAERCAGAFEGSVGASDSSSSLEWIGPVPSERNWDLDRRLFACLVKDPAGTKLIGSMAGTGL